MLLAFEDQKDKWEQKWIRPKFDMYEQGFVRWDRVKWLEITYTNSIKQVNFNLYPWNNDTILDHVTIKYQKKIQVMTYYEFEVTQDIGRFNLK